MPPRALDEAARILETADARHVTLRLLGGTAILMRCPSSHAGPLVRARAPDLDFAGFKKENTGIQDVFGITGYRPNENFNALHGYKQLMFFGQDDDLKVDVFLDTFEMCHHLDLRPRLGLSRSTLPLADLLFTKLQIVQINEKDVKDIIALLYDHPVESRDAEDAIDGGYLARLASTDWGIYTTLTDNLGKVQSMLPEFRLPSEVTEKARASLQRLRSMLDGAPKSLGWRLRARVGRRMVWYDLPEEPKAIRLGGSP